MMNVRFLGMWGGFPQAGSATSSFLLEHEGFVALIDCGSGVLAQLQKFMSIDQLDAVLISHYHHDHVADVGCLQYAWLVHTQLGTIKRALPVYAHAQDQEQWSKLTFKDFTKGNTISPDQGAQKIGPWNVSFCQTKHPAYCLAMKFECDEHRIVYTADTEWSDELLVFAHGADLLICESNLYAEQFGQVPGHLTATQAGQLANRAKVNQLVLTHLPHFGDHQQLLKEAQDQFGGPVHLAIIGLNISLVV